MYKMAAADGDRRARWLYLLDKLLPPLGRQQNTCALDVPFMALERVDAPVVDPAAFDLLQAGGPYIMAGDRPIKITRCEHVKGYGRAVRDMTALTKDAPFTRQPSPHTPSVPLEVVDDIMGPQLMNAYMHEAAHEMRSRYVVMTHQQMRVACVLTTDGRLTIWNMVQHEVAPILYNALRLDYRPDILPMIQGKIIQIACTTRPPMLYVLTQSGRVFSWGSLHRFQTREDQTICRLYEYYDTTAVPHSFEVVGLEKITVGDTVTFKLNRFHGLPYLHNGVTIQYVMVSKQKDHLFVFDASGTAYCDSLDIPEACMPRSHAVGPAGSQRVPRVRKIVTLSGRGHADGIAMLFGSADPPTSLSGPGRVVSWYHPAAEHPCVHVVHDDVLSMVATKHACAVKKRDGRVESWGLPTFGGDCSAVSGDLVTIRQLIRVQDVHHDTGAFMALRSDGRVVRWGTGIIEVADFQQLLNNDDFILMITHKSQILLRRANGQMRICGPAGEDKNIFKSRLALILPQFLHDVRPEMRGRLLVTLPSVAALRPRHARAPPRQLPLRF
jgi:hypothetical protein